jgi:hypothetical protein
MPALDELQELMRAERGWSAERVAAERAAVDAHLERYLAERPSRASDSRAH